MTLEFKIAYMGLLASLGMVLTINWDVYMAAYEAVQKGIIPVGLMMLGGF